MYATVARQPIYGLATIGVRPGELGIDEIVTGYGMTEELLTRHPGVSQAYAVGVPRRQVG